MDRGRLLETFRCKGEYLIRKIEKMYEIYKVTMKQGYTQQFRTMKGVRQGYVMSPLLFNLYIADIDNELEKKRIKRVRLGRNKIWSLAYTDDLVLVAYNREALQDMMSTLKKFLEGRNDVWREGGGYEKGKRNGNGGVRN